MSEPKNDFTTTFLKRYSLTSTAPSQELDHALAENIQRRQIMRGTAIILVGVLVFGPTAACAEPLFFDCKGTSHISAENQDPGRADIDMRIQL